MRYRLSLDLGTNSIGWALLALEGAPARPAGIIATGVRIFSDGRNPKDGQSLAVMRRGPRQMRRRRDRYLCRRRRLMDAFIHHGLMPGAEADRKVLEPLDPYELRARGLDAPLTLPELGRAIFHLNQRRGFQSNRKVDKADDDKGKIKTAIGKLREDMAAAGARTAGEYLYRRHAARQPVRARLHGEGAKSFYDFYPDRGLTKEEFNRLWEKQAGFHPELTEDARTDIAGILFFQRPLRPVRPGKCTFEPTEERAPQALPAVQRFRILQELNHLRLKQRGQPDRPLNVDERNKLALLLSQGQNLAFSGRNGIRAKLGLDSDISFNLESEKRKELKGDKTAARLSKKTLFGKNWTTIPAPEQNAIVERLLDDPDEAGVIAWLMADYGMSEDQAEAIANANTALPDGHAALGRTALAKILPELERDVVNYDEAVRRAGYHHSDMRNLQTYNPETGEVYDVPRFVPLDELPYYGIPLNRHVAFGTGDPDDPEEKRYGKIANPTVHVALLQVEKLVNAAIRKYGPPEECIIEVGRDLKNSGSKKEEIKAEQKLHQDRNDEFRREFSHIHDNGENRLRYRLWKELGPGPLDRHCPYSGEPISATQLFSSEVDIDHILPFSRTLDDSAANKVVCKHWSNKIKGNRTPYEAFNGSGHPKIDYESILDRAEVMPRNKKWRFQPDAMDHFNTEERDFLDRQLTDTQYLSRIAKEYLSKVCDPNKVWVTPGRLTAMLRRTWNLNPILPDHNRMMAEPVPNKKNRTDHRHHAIDAIVIGVTDRGLLNEVSRIAGLAEDQELHRLLKDMPEPWPNFRNDVQEKVLAIIVSHKPNHGRAGALHNDTAYGIVSGPNAKGVSEVVTRIPITSLQKPADLDLIRDAAWREKIRARLDGIPVKEWKQALQALSNEEKIRRIRVVQPLSVIPIKDKTGRTYKAYKGDSNCCYEIFQTPKGKWDGEVISTFDANQKNFVAQWHRDYPTAPLVMRLFKDDMIELDHDGQRRVMRVVKFSEGAIFLAEHFEGGSLKARDAAPNEEDPFKYLIKSPSSLQKVAARKAAKGILS